jgi:hypothetical protein
MSEWLRTFLPARRAVLERGLTHWYSAGRVVADRMWRFRFFAKREWLPRTESKDHVMVPIQTLKPRGIQPPYGTVHFEDVGHLVAGPVLRAFTHAIKEIWAWDTPIFYASATPDLLDRWLNSVQHASTFIWSDYSMFDCTHSNQTWDFLEPLYLSILDPDGINADAFRKLLRGWRTPIGRAHAVWGALPQVIRYFSIAMNASGRDDTAIANVLLNGFAMFLCLTAIHFGIDLELLEPSHVEQFASVARLAVVGDDSLVALPKYTATGAVWAQQTGLLSTFLKKFGFLAKVGASERIVDAVFLGCRPYRVANVWRWGPTLGRRLYKHHCCIHPDANPIAWLNGIANMEAQYLGFVPIIGAMGRQCRALLSGRKVTPWKADRYHGLNWSERTAPLYPDADTYHYCALAYTTHHGVVTAQDLLAVEELVGGVKELPVILGGLTLERILTVDEL